MWKISCKTCPGFYSAGILRRLMSLVRRNFEIFVISIDWIRSVVSHHSHKMLDNTCHLICEIMLDNNCKRVVMFCHLIYGVMVDNNCKRIVMFCHLIYHEKFTHLMQDNMIFFLQGVPVFLKTWGPWKPWFRVRLGFTLGFGV